MFDRKAAAANAGRRAVLAVDIGTTSVKTLAVAPDGGVLGSHAVAYPLYTPSHDAAEQEPDEILDGVLTSIREAVRAAGLGPDEVAGVVFSSAMHSLIALDRDHRPLTRSWTWADQRGAAQADRLRADGAGLAIYLRTGTPIHPMSPLVKLIRMRETMPDVVGQTACFVGIKEYVLLRLFGERVVDHSIASATGLFNLETLDWDEEALRLACIREDQLPRAVPATHRLSGLSPETAERLGLRCDTPFVVGASDGVLANLGIGAMDEGVFAVTIGTSGAVRAAVRRPTLDRRGRLFCYALAAGWWIAGGATNNGAIVARWLADRLYPGRPLDEVLPLAGGAPPGADGLLFLPLLSGERAPFWDAHAKGTLVGLTLAHRAEHLLRAGMEGVLFQIRAIVALLAEAAGRPQRVLASGGFARSALWCQMAADVLGVPVAVPDLVESSAWGAAQLGYYALEGKGPLRRWRPADETVYAPDAAASRVYEALFPTYLSLYEQVKSHMRELSHFQTRRPDER